MNKLVVFGCSLSSLGNNESWSDKVAEALPVHFINYAVASSSNQLQMKRFQEFILTNTVSDNDIILWQITGYERTHVRAKNPIVKNKDALIKTSPNHFDGIERCDTLSHSGITYKFMDENDAEQRLEELLFHLVSANKFTKKLLVIFGWDEVMPEDYMIKFKQVLTQKNIQFENMSIVTWAKQNNFSFPDGYHPGKEAYKSFANDIVLPKLKTLGWAE